MLNRLRECVGHDVSLGEFDFDIVVRFHKWLAQEIQAKTATQYVTTLAKLADIAKPGHAYAQQLETYLGRDKPKLSIRKTDASEGSFRWFIERHYATENDVSESTLDHYHYVTLSYARFVGSNQLSSINRNDVNRWLVHLQNEELSPFTIQQRRISLLTIWRAAYELELLEDLPKRIRKIKTPDKVIETLSTDQINKIHEISNFLRGRIPRTRILKSDYFRTFIQATLETAMRQSDLHALSYHEVFHRGKRTIIQIKTGHRRQFRFSNDLIEDIDSWHPKTGNIWPRAGQQYLSKRISDLGKAIGVKLTHTILRKTAITNQEAKQVGTGWIFAGHKSPDTTRQWYTNQDIAYADLFKDNEN